MRWSWSGLRRWWNPDGEAEGVRELSRGQAVRLPSSGEGSSLRLRSGLVVVTREGDSRDHLLEPGSELQLPGRGRVVAWALEASRIEIRNRTVSLADWRSTAVVRAPTQPGRGEAAPGRWPANGRERQDARPHGRPPPRPDTPVPSPAGGGADPG